MSGPSPHGEPSADGFSIRVRVRYGETDQMGVVHHAAYLHYLEDARTAWMRSLGCPYGEVEATGVGLPVRRVDLKYRTPARYDDELDVRVSVSRLRSASVTFQYQVVRSDGVELAEAEVELACVDLATGRPRHFPEELKLSLRDTVEK